MGKIFSDGSWLNPPTNCDDSGGHLSLTTGDKTDFWQDTHYGFQRDTGHFWYRAAPQAFTARLTFEGQYEALYDQAGLMVRTDARAWIKCGIEHSDGATNFSIVVTRRKSDWSVVRMPLLSGPQSVRLTLTQGAVIAHFLTPDGGWHLMRVADFPVTGPLSIGPMACSPERSGFRARFLDFDLTDPIPNALHG